MINSTSKYKDEAAEFINWFIQPEVQTRYWGTAIQTTGTIGAVPDKNVLPRTYKWRSELNQLQAVYPPTDQAFGPELLHVLFEVQDAVVMGELTPEQAAARMQEAMAERRR